MKYRKTIRLKEWKDLHRVFRITPDDHVAIRKYSGNVLKADFLESRARRAAHTANEIIRNLIRTNRANREKDIGKQ